jgi:hypothetical protein
MKLHHLIEYPMPEHTAGNKTQQSHNEKSSDQTRREFLNKFGKLAIITPVAMTALMTPGTSAAPKSCRGNGSKRCR